jgi:tripartite ATP-independent transporter DctP family solute receptor
MIRRSSISAALLACAAIAAQAPAQPVATLRYSHMNSPASIPGRQADFFASRVRELSGGSIAIEVYPNSRLGTLQEQVEEVSSGVVAFHHNTAGGIGALFEDFGVLDTPYLYKDVDQLLRATDPGSPLMARLGAGLLKKSGVRVLYTFYFGARQLTCDRPIRRPEDLKSVKVRSIPFPIYRVAVEGLGAIPTPIDWAQTVTALEAKVVSGQENPVDIILDSKLYESQGYLMLTGHILAADIVVVNDGVWRKLSASQRDAVIRAAAEASAFATRLTLSSEAAELARLKEKGMKVIGPAEGLDIEAFRERTATLVRRDLAPKWGEYYRLIEGAE